jgi:hypothetical protein
MIRLTKPLLAVSAVAAALALALPAAAQQQPPIGDPGQPNPVRAPEVCVPGGTALAVLAGDATVAKIIGMPVREAANTGATPRVITLNQPGAVGACAQFQGFWADGVAGQAGAALQLFSAGDTTTALAQDGWRGQQTGPFIQGKPLRAFTKVDKPGTYQFVAVLSVHAGAADPTSAQPADGAKDARRIPFTVILRGKGSISGVVLDASGAPVAGAQVRADPPPNVTPRGGGFVELPVIGPTVLGDEANPADRLPPNVAITDKDGKYKIVLPTGKYIVAAQARGFKVQWFDAKDLPKDATPVELTADAPDRGDVSFALAAGEPGPGPQPGGKGKITGLVTDGTNPIKGAKVIAGPAGALAGGQPLPGGNPALSLAAVTKDDGTYELVLPAGKWLVQSVAPLFKPQWHNGKVDPKTADPVEVADGATVPNINFSLAPAPHATVSGVVRDKDGNLAKKALVMAVRRPLPPTPLDPAGGAVRGPTVFTDDSGAYIIVVEPGTWAIGAGPGLNARPGSTVPLPTLWWNDKTKLEDADLLTLADGDANADINFQLK